MLSAAKHLWSVLLLIASRETSEIELVRLPDSLAATRARLNRPCRSPTRSILHFAQNDNRFVVMLARKTFAWHKTTLSELT